MPTSCVYNFCLSEIQASGGQNIPTCRYDDNILQFIRESGVFLGWDQNIQTSLNVDIFIQIHGGYRQCWRSGGGGTVSHADMLTSWHWHYCLFYIFDKKIKWVCRQCGDLGIPMPTCRHADMPTFTLLSNWYYQENKQWSCCIIMPTCRHHMYVICTCRQSRLRR